MKGTLNKVMLIGRLGADPDLKQTLTGASVASFSLATNEAWKDKDGNAQERTEWHRVVLWQKQAEIAAQYLKKGHRVYIEGRLQTRSWDDKDGNKRYSTEIVASSMEFLEGKQTGNGQRDDGAENAPAPKKTGPVPETQEDDLPF